MSNLFARGVQEKSLFALEEVFYPEHMPERLPHRDAELQEMVSSLQPLTKGGRARHLFVHGNSGTGKTVSVRHVMKELAEFSSRARHLYINCFKHNTRHAVLTELAAFLSVAMPRRGVATDEVITEMQEHLRESNFSPVLVLDEADQLLHEGECSKLLYDLLRMYADKNAVALVLISNDPATVAKLDGRVRSSLQAHEIAFEPYTPQQLKDILRERCKAGFTPDVVEDDVINVAAAHAAKQGGDARIAIQAVWNAGREADIKGANLVTVAHLKSALSKVTARKAEKAVPHLDETSRTLLKLLCKEKKQFTGDLYEAYTKATKEPLSSRAVRQKLSRLEDTGIIKTEDSPKESKGRSRIICLAVPVVDVEKLLQAVD